MAGDRRALERAANGPTREPRRKKGFFADTVTCGSSGCAVALAGLSPPRPFLNSPTASAARGGGSEDESFATARSSSSENESPLKPLTDAGSGASSLGDGATAGGMRGGGEAPLSAFSAGKGARGACSALAPTSSCGSTNIDGLGRILRWVSGINSDREESSMIPSCSTAQCNSNGVYLSFFRTTRRGGARIGSERSARGDDGVG